MVPDLNPVVNCKYLHLPRSGASRAFQRTAMPGSCLHAQGGDEQVGEHPFTGSRGSDELRGVGR